MLRIVIIRTTYCAPTDHKGARISATMQATKEDRKPPAVMPYPYSVNPTEAHESVARQYAKRHRFGKLIGSEPLANGWYFVFERGGAL